MKKSYKIFMLLITLMIFFNVNIVRATDELSDDGGIITSSQVIQTKTGTGPWDDDDEAGNDSSEDNNIVRSFDQVTWTIENTMALNGGTSESYTGGTIYFKATLPDTFTSETIKWDIDSMAWIENAQISDDGLTLTGYYSLTTESITIPGKQTLVFVARILGASNGIEFAPEVALWLNGNSEDEYITVIPDKVVVSAAPRYNVVLKQNSYCQKKTTVDYGNGDTLGRMYGYSLTLELYNEDISKGLKGIEYPKGEISFDIDLQLQRSFFESTELEDITSECTPVLWNYKVNQSTSSGIIDSRTMNFGNNTGFERYIPYGVKSTDRTNSVYNSGNIVMTQSGSKINVTINDYKFDGVFPHYSARYYSNSGLRYKENEGIFGAYYFQIFVPDNDASTVKDRNYYLKVNDSNFLATSISEVLTSSQAITTDDVSTINHVLYKPGVYNHTFTLVKDKIARQPISSNFSTGDAVAALEEKFRLESKFEMNQNNDDDIYSATKFIKFDGDCYEPILYDDGTKYYKVGIAGDITFNVWYITKKDGTNWLSQEEMNNADIKDMLYFENIEDIPEGYICVGEYLESISGVLTPETGDNNIVVTRFKVKNTAKVGQTYGITGITKVWKDYVDRDIYTITAQNFDEWPEVTWDSGYRQYIKTEYDSDDNMISGTHSGGWYYGQTLLVVGAMQKVQISPIDNTTGEEKINYDLGKNEYNVTYKIQPILTNEYSSAEINDVTVKITATLPEGLTYNANTSSAGEPEITVNTDGTTSLVWYITGCSVNEAIDDITFEAHINEESSNGTQYNVTAQMYADPDKVGTTAPDDRTAETGIQVINLASHRLYKSVITPVIEKNGEIHYTVSYKNNTDETISDFQLLDILPYNGDSRGTSFNGTYTLDRLVVKQEDSTGTLSNDNLTICYTNDESVRDTVTSKDEGLGDNWTTTTSEDINSSATAFVVKGELGSQAKVTVDIYLKTSDNKALDKYVNSSTAQVYKLTEEMTTSNVVAQVVSRKIEGIAWEDSNANGVKDNDENVLSGVEITLTNDVGEQVTDVNGDKVSSVKTDGNGHYIFADLPKGKYYVKVSLPSSKYTLTEKGVGLNVEVNSKFEVDAKETDEIDNLNNMDIPEITVSNVNAGFVKKETKVIVNYKEVGTDTTLYEETTISGRIDDSYETEDKIDEINEVNDNKYEYVKVEGNTTGEMTEDTIYVTYYYQKKQGEIEVNYLEKGTETVLADKVTSSGQVDSKYTTEDKIDEINENNDNKYEFVETTGDETEGVYKLDKQVINYYYQKKQSSIEVNYVDIDTKDVLSDQVTKEGQIDSSYTTENKLDEINKNNDNKYEYVKVEGNTEGTYTVDKQTITYYYQKKQGEIEVNYLEKGTETVLTDKVTSSGQVDSSYTTEDKIDEINENYDNKYEFVETTGDATEGVYKLDKQVINYYYQKKQSSIEVNYLEVGTNTVLADQVTKEGQIDSSYTTENKLDEINDNYDNKYEYVKVEGNTEGTYTVDKQTITYYYQKKATNVKVLHVLEGTDVTNPETVTDVLYNTEEITGKVDDSYTTQNRLSEINQNSKVQYELVSDEVANKNGNMTIDTIYVVYEYKTIPAVVKVNHLEKDTDTVLYEQETLNGLVGNEYTTSDKLDNINETYSNKYELVAEPENKAGTYTKEEQTVTYYYQKKQSSIEVNYLEVGTNTVLAEQVTKQGQIDSSYTTENKLDEINENNSNKYEFVETTGADTEGIYTVDKQTINYYYQKKAANVKVLHVEEGTDITNPESVTDVLYNTEEITGKVDDSYTTQNRVNEINANSKLQYELVSVTDNASGNMTLDTQYVIYVYKKIPTKVTVKYVDIDTNEELVDGETKTGVVGEEYETEDKVEEINKTNKNKYVLEKTTENTEGTMTKETIEVIYYYKKVEAQVVVKYVDEATGEEIEEREYIGGYVGDRYETKSKEIEKYILVEKKLPENGTGEMTEDVIEVIYYYSKVEESVPTGDIEVYNLVAIAVISVICITYVARKNILD